MAALDDVLNRVDGQLDASVERLFAFLRIPSISTDPAFAAQCRLAAESAAATLGELGLSASVRETAGHPAVIGRTDTGAARRVLFYGHYDVQPVDPLDLWETPPFEPVLATDASGRARIVGRGACDDKGQVFTFLEALRAHRDVAGRLPVDVTVLLEGEEECGSPSLPAFLAAHAGELAADVALVCDTGMWDRDTPAITTALRGIVHCELTVSGADRDLHSGLFGGAARNPTHVLAGIIADLHDAAGRVTIPGFYDAVREPPEAVRRQWAGLGFTAESFLGPVGLAISAGEADRMLIEQIQSRPTAEVNGMYGGYTGQGSKTIIPASATAKISFRLVADQDPAAIKSAFADFVAARVPADCKVQLSFGEGSRAVLVPPESPDLAKAAGALEAEWGRAPVEIGSGGSIPIVGQFKAVLGMDTLLIGFGLDDDRVHSPNEKYDMASFRKGTRSWVRILDALA
ncbi:M20/M25/M40 family metallo-hydrolase [Aquabacter spiritensis]|uniref:Acetylornithine deacetylase/succinyl-diaminopimelate desuccinylase-like protein n=1 Tax=Aquabacter spiritensis TaxID=933073 RepID=A0A4R3LTS8_9HYPH|nr:M20/M25/M40 family metallo-hydrolase [Aquabacter spiritensis]TCT02989.1 acetylornithine deacetylase/succinyl-diaminopimelate desuccinylase-like protein [Aquabacter spiritensis]